MMNLIVWNYRGLGNLRIGKELGDIIWTKDPSVVFTAKTLTDEARLDQVMQDIDFDKKMGGSQGRPWGWSCSFLEIIN